MFTSFYAKIASNQLTEARSARFPMIKIENTDIVDYFKKEANSNDPENIIKYIRENYFFIDTLTGEQVLLLEGEDEEYSFTEPATVTNFKYISKSAAFDHYLQFEEPIDGMTRASFDKYGGTDTYGYLRDNVYPPTEPPRPDYATIYVPNTHLVEHFAPQALNLKTTEHAIHHATHNKDTIIDHIRVNYRVHQVSKTEFYYSTKKHQPETSKKQSTPYLFCIRLDHEPTVRKLHINKVLRKYLDLTLAEYRADYVTINNYDHSIAVRRVDAQEAFKSPYITATVLKKIKRAIKEQIYFHNVLD